MQENSRLHMELIKLKESANLGSSDLVNRYRQL